jgi:diaminopimelate decarboxylase
MLQYLDFGGGLAIDYDRAVINGESESADLSLRPSIAEWFEVLRQAVAESRYRLLVEPGRSVVGSAGLLLTRVLYTKNQAGRRMIVADAGMTDLVRPALYGARHPIVPVVRAKTADGDQVGLLDIAGPVCESADFLARAVPLPALKPGDLLAVLQAGAYGFAMSSNYNGRPRPEEVLVEGSNVRCIRRRESYDDLLGKGDPC